MISIVVTNWNGKHLLKPCLASIMQQTCKDHETIVVDQASSDGSVEYIAREFPWVRLVHLGRHGGYAPAANAGIRAAKGEYIAFLNNDAEARPPWLEEMLRALAGDPKLGFVGAKILDLRRPKVIASAGGRFSRNGSAGDIGRGEPDSAAFDTPRPVLWTTGAACMFRREVFDAVGLFDESFGCMSEDVDICFRAQLRGFRGLYCPSAVVYHAISATWGADTRERLHLCSRNENRVIVKNLPLRVLAECLPRIVAHQAWLAVKSLLRRDNWSYLRGKLEFLLELDRLCRARREIQRGRTVSDEYIRSLIQ